MSDQWIRRQAEILQAGNQARRLRKMRESYRKANIRAQEQARRLKQRTMTIEVAKQIERFEALAKEAQHDLNALEAGAALLDAEAKRLRAEAGS